MRIRTLLTTSLLCLMAVAAPAHAQTIIRDAEIEEYMAEWFDPIYRAANMSPDQVKIILVQDSQVNAFVAGGSNIFFYTGLLQKTENPGEVIGVMAHELGHIAGGHLIRGREAMEQASYESILGMILGGAAAIATGDGSAMAAGSMAGSSMAQRGFLKHTRTFESSADQAALSYFEKAKMNPAGFESFLRKLEGQEMLPSSQQSEYVRSHPLTRSRVETVMARAEQSPYNTAAFPQEWSRQHKMMLAKLTGFITPQQVAWVYNDKDNSRESLTARTIAAYRTNDVARALKLSDQMLAIEPENPWFLELRGQMLMDFGRVAEAIPYYQKSLKQKPDAGLIRISLAHAQIETAGNNKTKLEEALANLKRAQKTEARSTRIHRLMATAYGRLGDEPSAKLHLAEEAVLQGKYDYAAGQAKTAMAGLKSGSPDWIRAQDLLNYIETTKSRRKNS